MNKAAGFAALASIVVMGTAATVSSTRPAPAGSGTVTVHCPAGDSSAFVTPASLTIQLGDSVVWRTTGRTPADSIWITPKDPSAPWPFDGAAPAGGGSASTGRSTSTGTVRYNVQLACRVRGVMQTIVIDPDIIIQES